MKKFTLLSKVVTLMLFVSIFNNQSANAGTLSSNASSSVSKSRQVDPPSPTLSTVTSAPVCIGSQSTVFLSGLLPNTPGTATYKVGNGGNLSASGTSTSTGTFNFVTPVLNALQNGVVVEITSITSNGVTTNFTGKTTTLVVSQIPTLSTVTAEPTCAGTAATVVLSGLNPNTAGTATYRVNGGQSVTQSGTSDANGMFSFPTNVLPASANGAVISITKISTNSGCETIFTDKSATLVVYPAPTLTNLTVTPVCAGKSTTVTLSGLLPSIAIDATYTINGGMPQIVSGTSASNGTFSFSTPVLNAASNGAVLEVTKISTALCATMFTGKTVSLVVNSLPNVQITGTPRVCRGESFNLTASGGVSYAWQGSIGSNNGVAATRFTSSNANISRSLNGLTQYHRIGVYTVTVTDANGCVNSATETVGVNPSVLVSTSPLPLQVCEGSDFTVSPLLVTFTNVTKINTFPYYAISAANQDDLTYSWSGPSWSGSSSRNAVVNGASSNNAGSYNLTVTGPGGCTATATRNVIVNANPTITLDSSAQVCEGSNITLTGASNAGTLSWFKDGNFISFGASITINSADMSDAGIYTFRARRLSSGCFSEKNIELIVNPLPTLSTVTSEIACAGTPAIVVLSGLNPNTTGVATYTVGGGPLVTQAGTSDANGVFSFPTNPLPANASGVVIEITSITTAGGCTTNFANKTVALRVESCPQMSAKGGQNSNGSSKKAINVSTDLKVYPNPAQNVLNIDTAAEGIIVEVLNMQGQKMLTSTEKQVNISNLPTGTYLVRVQDAQNNVVVKRVIKN